MMMPRPCPSASRLLFSDFQIWPKIPLKLAIFPLWKNYEIKKVLSNLEAEEQGRGIIMGVTHLLLLGPFYSIQTNFMYYFAHDCISFLNHLNNNRRLSIISKSLFVKVLCSVNQHLIGYPPTNETNLCKKLSVCYTYIHTYLHLTRMQQRMYA